MIKKKTKTILTVRVPHSVFVEALSNALEEEATKSQVEAFLKWHAKYLKHKGGVEESDYMDALVNEVESAASDFVCGIKPNGHMGTPPFEEEN